MAENKTVTLVHRDFDFKREFDASDAVEITQARAMGWAEQAEITAAVKAEKSAEAAK